MKATIFDIQRNSYVDGPGIRTTVFFKGCNLKCKWCHNPESQSGKPQMMFFKNKCTGCGKCINVCPNKMEKCNLCGTCADICPNNAREICGRTYAVEDVLNEVVKDKMFYETSGGGVTFSGGECMLQIEFLEDILKTCKENGIHTAVDTAGCVPWESFKKIMPYTDLFLYDVKCFSEELHIEGTGASNKIILENLERLSKCFGGSIIIRVPVISGFNDNLEEMKKIADFLSHINLKDVELLPYHKMGEHKYDALGMEFTKYNVTDKDVIKMLESFLAKY